MSQQESKLWSRLVDANWQLSTAPSGAALMEYAAARKELIELIGETKFKEFIQAGQKMFGIKAED